jgi:hypothetical protein
LDTVKVTFLYLADINEMVFALIHGFAATGTALNGGLAKAGPDIVTSSLVHIQASVMVRPFLFGKFRLISNNKVLWRDIGGLTQY